MPLGALPLGLHGGHMNHLNNFESSTPNGDSCHVWLNFWPCIFKKKMKVTFYYIEPPAPTCTCRPPQGLNGATLGTVMNNFYSSPMKISTHNIAWLSYIWRRRSGCLKFTYFWPLGSLPRGPMGAMCTTWTTLNPLPLRMIPAKFGWIPTMHFQEEDETVTFYIEPPTPTCHPLRGPMGRPWELSQKTYSSPKKVSTHTIAWLFYIWIWTCLKFTYFWPLGPSPWAPMGVMCTTWTTLNPLPLRKIPAKFG